MADPTRIPAYANHGDRPINRGMKLENSSASDWMTRWTVYYPNGDIFQTGEEIEYFDAREKLLESWKQLQHQ